MKKAIALALVLMFSGALSSAHAVCAPAACPCSMKAFSSRGKAWRADRPCCDGKCFYARGREMAYAPLSQESVRRHSGLVISALSASPALPIPAQFRPSRGREPPSVLSSLLPRPLAGRSPPLA